jgi:hypothetical protein
MLPTVVNLLKACEGHRPLIREAACTAEAVGEACSLLFRLALRCASSHFEGRFPWVDGRLPWVARRRANTWCPRDRALSRSRSAILQGGSLVQPKLTESRRDHARSPQRAAFLFLTTSVAV